MTTSVKLSFSILVEPDGEGFYAHSPAFKGIHVDGKTEEEALKRAIEAVHCYLKSMARHNEPLPMCSDLLMARASVSGPRPRVRLRKRYEVQWPSLQACGIS
jgi:predicted RNase H-like HicB family nuclease